MRQGNTDIEEGHLVWMYLQDGMSKKKLGGHSKGPFEVIRKFSWMLVIKRVKVLERFSSDRLENTRTPKRCQTTESTSSSVTGHTGQESQRTRMDRRRDTGPQGGYRREALVQGRLVR